LIPQALNRRFVMDVAEIEKPLVSSLLRWSRAASSSGDDLQPHPCTMTPLSRTFVVMSNGAPELQSVSRGSRT